jgi:hypothetical protein
VTTAASCAWTVVNNAASWITLTSAASATGSGNVTFTVATNTGPARTGTLTIAGQTFTLSQAAMAPCTYSLAPPTQNATAAGGAGTPITITTAAGCAWNATTSASWITLTSSGPGNGTSGTGNGTVNFTVAANTGAARSGTITIGGQTVTVNQAAVAVACTYSINPTSRQVVLLGGASTIAVTAPASCAWTATSNAPWIVVTSGASGTGNGTVNITVQVTVAARSGTVTIANQTFTVNQSGL